jgi:hypothetical protein
LRHGRERHQRIDNGQDERAQEDGLPEPLRRWQLEV